MEYTVHELARLAGVSTRTLRYYDQIGLLKPAAVRDNGYRSYGPAQVDRLQQILFYRELEVPLAKVRGLLDADEGDRQAALERHLAALNDKKQQVERLIQTVDRTLLAMKGERSMSDAEKFEGFKTRKLAENRAKYGTEVTARYGAAALEASEARVRAMDQGQWTDQEGLAQEILTRLAAAKAVGDPADPAAQQVCDLHRQWLCLFWPEGSYSPAAHLALAEGYVADPRFTAYYDEAAGPGATQFLRDAIAVYTEHGAR